MSSRRWNGTMSILVCPDCAIRLTVPRCKGKQREKGHIKDEWCPRCKEVRKFVEVRECDFVLENVLA